MPHVKSAQRSLIRTLLKPYIFKWILSVHPFFTLSTPPPQDSFLLHHYHHHHRHLSWSFAIISHIWNPVLLPLPLPTPLLQQQHLHLSRVQTHFLWTAHAILSEIPRSPWIAKKKLKHVTRRLSAQFLYSCRPHPPFFSSVSLFLLEYHYWRKKSLYFLQCHLLETCSLKKESLPIWHFHHQTVVVVVVIELISSNKPLHNKIAFCRTRGLPFFWGEPFQVWWWQHFIFPQWLLRKREPVYLFNFLLLFLDGKRNHRSWKIYGFWWHVGFL